jgi:hypothetical protein
MRPHDCGLLAAGLIVVAIGGCGTAATRTHRQGGAPPGPPPTLPVTGEVMRSCSGPLVQGQPPRCSDRAVLQSGGHRVVVTGRFSIRLKPGRYRVSVDTCINQETLNVNRPITGLKLIPRCPVPL